MGAYSLLFKPSVEKDLGKLPNSITRLVLKKIQQLPITPISSQTVKLAGTDNFYRIRIGDYRVIYGVDIPPNKSSFTMSDTDAKFTGLCKSQS